MNMSEPANQLLGPSYSRWLHSGVVTALGRQIVGGSFQPGDVLNMERPEGELSVSRSVLWEAVRVLSAKGLLEARPKRGTIVCPPPKWNLLDPDVMVWKVRSGGDEQYLRNSEEVRRIIDLKLCDWPQSAELRRIWWQCELLSKGFLRLLGRLAVRPLTTSQPT